MEGAPGRGSAGGRERPPGGERGSEGAGGGGRPVLGEASAAHRQSRRRSRGGGALRGAGGGAARSHPGWQPGAPETGRRGAPWTRGGGQTQGPGPHRRWRRPRPLASVRHARATGRSPDQPRVPGCCRGGPGPALLSSSPRSSVWSTYRVLAIVLNHGKQQETRGAEILVVMESDNKQDIAICYYGLVIKTRIMMMPQ
ncbi:uncharacterized protein [Sagmatias obliquidens]|uniref:uncharacterized protein isoform X2 n=1 Tax=Sagmatias obliquidens TaxID=3371155 RepID=UPI000F43FD80|nr:uncharacterized protein LOC113610157 isoform X2 [Lagenorhynchus obliquidens]